VLSESLIKANDDTKERLLGLTADQLLARVIFYLKGNFNLR
jgi:hypothetical protein